MLLCGVGITLYTPSICMPIGSNAISVFYEMRNQRELSVDNSLDDLGI